jgi:hypothetical protein
MYSKFLIVLLFFITLQSDLLDRMYGPSYNGIYQHEFCAHRCNAQFMELIL